MSKFSLSQLILGNPFVYWSYQKLVGGDRARRLFIKNQVRPQVGQKILDIGCGPGNILDYLPEMDYYGFDVDPEYIEAAKKNYGDRGTFICANASEFKVSEPHSFDVVIATGVIHHLNDSETKRLFEIAAEALKPNARLVTFDGCYIKGQHIISKYMLKFDRGKFVRTQESYEALAGHSFSKIDSTIDESYFRIPYTSIFMECQNV
ncbi:class I SAM-dependent methyltransferase [Psychroserpens algicola]|uniref:class I SAM-dependent methyltransferase n=1 Tax=Psychroserpens algicola TaxID=1719034 RepID=UPI0019536586|nr:class I SAM-dependent methyltransferase [Psychroserpens algicola]